MRVKGTRKRGNGLRGSRGSWKGRNETRGKREGEDRGGARGETKRRGEEGGREVGMERQFPELKQENNTLKGDLTPRMLT